jgi:hypothetical protein
MKKVKLQDLNVKSFVTSIKEEERDALKGGGGSYHCPTPPQPATIYGQVCNTETLDNTTCVISMIPTGCDRTGYYTTVDAPCGTVNC